MNKNVASYTTMKLFPTFHPDLLPVPVEEYMAYVPDGDVNEIVHPIQDIEVKFYAVTEEAVSFAITDTLYIYIQPDGDTAIIRLIDTCEQLQIAEITTPIRYFKNHIRSLIQKYRGTLCWEKDA